jgi:hypothetical protein
MTLFNKESSENNQNLRNSWEGILTLVPTYIENLNKIKKLLGYIEKIYCPKSEELCNIYIFVQKSNGKYYKVFLDSFMNKGLKIIHSLINKSIKECVDDEYIKKETTFSVLSKYIINVCKCLDTTKEHLLYAYCDGIKAIIDDFGTSKLIFEEKKNIKKLN